MISSQFGGEFKGLQIILADEAQIANLSDLFVEMYAHFKKSNGITELPIGGFKNWLVGYDRSRLISRTVFACYDNTRCVALIEGQIKIGGAMSGQGRLGHIAHLYVQPDYRRNGIARALVKVQRSWFSTKNIAAETLDVVCGNTEALGFWSSLGYKPLFINMIKPAS